MILFYLLVGVMPLSQHALWGRYFAELTGVKYLGAACLLYALFYLAARRELPSFFRTRQAILFTVLYCLAIISQFTTGGSRSNSWEISPILSYTSFLLLFFCTLLLIDSWSRLRWVILTAVGSVAFASLYILREWQKYHAIYPGFRPGWVTGDPNYFTLSAVLCLPLAFYWMRETSTPRWEKLFCLGSLILTFVAVMLAASRGGFLGLVTAFLFGIWHSRQRLRNLALVTVLLLPLALIAPASPLTRFLEPTAGDIEAATIRTELWKAGWQMIQENPLRGVGLGNFKFFVGRYAPPGETLDNIAHNTYIEVAAEMGLPALLALLGILFFSYRSLDRVRQATLSSGQPLLQQTALAIQSGLVGYSVSLCFISGQYQKLFWLMVFLSMCLPSLVASAIPQTTEEEMEPVWAAPPSLQPFRIQPGQPRVG